MSKTSENHQSMFRERLVTPHNRPSPMRLVIWITAILIIILGVWSTIAQLPEVAKTRGQVEPVGDLVLVQSHENGQVVKVLVEEGQTVDKGQVLMRLEPLQTKTDVNQLLQRTVFLKLELERLQAFTDNRKPDFSEYILNYPLMVDQQTQLLAARREEMDAEFRTLNERLSQKRQGINIIVKKLPVLKGQIKSSAEISQIYKNLEDKKIASKLERFGAEQRVLEFQKELEELQGMKKVLEREIIEVRKAKESLRQRMYSEAQQQRTKVLSELSEVNFRLQERQTSLDRLEIVSPVKGVIKHIPVTGDKAVVLPSDILAEIVPINVGLVFDIKISPHDIGFIKKGQDVTIRVDAFDYSRYGTLAGKITKISPSTFVNEQGDLYYEGQVSPAQNYLGSNEKMNLLVPGMTAEVDIVTGQKTLFQYMLKPVLAVGQKGFKER